ncbi:NACHT domain-containing protein [Amycolatopsis saalfeldensis]|uniref:NACHT domain-containing protein n=1 Tax=Amycolatopsis saalfeldensis TaxID=394193 RepID=A0A1H8U7W2_9PSEU|nr:NACHT domain-containing protein [Amycolatopsis saalfeldensis]SEO99271.1 NACHT domain-containing protein [Amycolatopsis saalfeldensis]
MSGLEGVLLALGASIVKSAAKVWMGDRQVAADATAQAVDLLTARVTGAVEQRRLRRTFEQMEEIVAERLAPLAEHEFRGVPESERLAALDAVTETFTGAALSDLDLFTADLDARFLYRSLVRAVPGVPERALLSADATEFYQRVLRECCAYLVQIVTTLPRFEAGALTELLRRDTQVLGLLREVLTRLPQSRDGEDFEADYRRQVVTALDRMTVFGATIGESSRRYPLSVAYLSLGVLAEGALPAPADSFDEEQPAAGGVTRIEELLPRTKRLFIRGDAGAGKTTLLQWISVRCAQGDLDGVAGWGDVVPFFLRLRRYVSEPFPAPEQFLTGVGRHIADEMPDGWVHRQLRSGRAVLLVDGVDELAPSRRQEAAEWLKELINAFPAARYVVTSRPGSVDAKWLREEHFVGAELQPMEQRDVTAFVHQWHDAMRAQSLDNEERTALDEFERQLVAAIAARRGLRRIVQNPLLCALLCALHRDRRAELPENRMELYEISLHLLLERRDKERGIVPPNGLSRIEQTLLLQDIAYWLVRNGWSGAGSARIVDRVRTKLAGMPQVHAGPDEVFRHLLERSGLLREPTVGQVDFVHRSFQEYLAAKAAVESDDIGVLVGNAGSDHWHEVVVMAAGHASARQREELLYGILRTESSTRQRNQLQLLALACLETSPELSGTLRAEIERRTATLLPPRSSRNARMVASAGEFVLDLLAKTEPETPGAIAATIEAAAEIGGDAALALIARFRGDTQRPVRIELIRAWPRFDVDRYARQVLAESPLGTSPLGHGYLRIDDPVVTPALHRLSALRQLVCQFGDGHGDWEFIRSLPRLRGLTVLDPALTDLTPLASANLEFLAILHGGPRAEPLDLTQLEPARTLTRLDLLTPATGYAALGALPRLTGLQLARFGDAAMLPELGRLTRLELVGLRDVDGLRDLAPLDFLDHPQWFGLHRCRDLSDITRLPRWAGTLQRVWLRDSPELDPAPLSALADLELLDLSGSAVESLEPLRGMKALQTLRLTDHHPLPDLAPLRDLPALRHLWLYDSTDVDLAPLAGREDLAVYLMRGQEAGGIELLEPSCRIHRK